MSQTASLSLFPAPAIELRGVSRRFADPGGRLVGVLPTSLRIATGEPPNLSLILGGAGVTLETAGVSVEQREISHLFAQERKGDKAVPRDWVYGLPEKLANPDAVIYDATPGREALLYVWRESDGRYVRVAVRPNFRMKGEAYTNAVRSAQMISGRDVQGPAFTLLEGSL